MWGSLLSWPAYRCTRGFPLFRTWNVQNSVSTDLFRRCSRSWRRAGMLLVLFHPGSCAVLADGVHMGEVVFIQTNECVVYLGIARVSCNQIVTIVASRAGFVFVNVAIFWSLVCAIKVICVLSKRCLLILESGSCCSRAVHYHPVFQEHEYGLGVCNSDFDHLHGLQNGCQ
jgi:hypothetical protein